ncbi:filamin-binding LIM protein 1-like [Delphinapterus leucas]|uniref:Filamin-binding LIM protein 1-like n=1 Tax=Delphinapterus leucas TaxID=9749 RepID=A0A2Y9PSB1_DELLE|nr:filamin-binding LIM protein 1-like [Delphinapterus leucas]
MKTAGALVPQHYGTPSAADHLRQNFSEAVHIRKENRSGGQLVWGALWVPGPAVPTVVTVPTCRGCPPPSQRRAAAAPAGVEPPAPWTRRSARQRPRTTAPIQVQSTALLSGLRAQGPPPPPPCPQSLQERLAALAVRPGEHFRGTRLALVGTAPHTRVRSGTRP